MFEQVLVELNDLGIKVTEPNPEVVPCCRLQTFIRDLLSEQSLHGNVPVILYYGVNNTPKVTVLLSSDIRYLFLKLITTIYVNNISKFCKVSIILSKSVVSWYVFWWWNVMPGDIQTLIKVIFILLT